MYKEDFVKQLVTFYKNSVENLRTVALTKNVEGITHNVVIPGASYSPWYDDPYFMSIYNNAKSNTLVDIFRCYELYSFIMKNDQLNGDVLEVGVWKGGSGSVLGAALNRIDQSRVVFLADTFKGVVKAGQNDTIYKGGEHSDTTIHVVHDLFKLQGLSNYRILEGIFPDEVDLPSKCEALRLCHIDVDTYESARDVFHRVWPLIVIGGAVIFDDYGFWGCEGITKLCNEMKLKDGTFIHNLNGHGMFIKVG
jgi:O-methyltransferase